MRRWPIMAIATIALALPLNAQPVLEQTVGRERLCTYQHPAGPAFSARTHRVPIGETCPATPPLETRGSTPPPTAELRSDRVVQGVRSCVYTQFGNSWSIQGRIDSPCPFSPAMIRSTRN